MHEQSIRKGSFPVHLGYENTCDTSSSVNARVGITDKAGVFRFELKPISENQRIDEEYFQSHRLTYIQVNEKQVLKGLRQFAKNHPHQEELHLEITTQLRISRFRVVSSRATTFCNLTLNL